MLQACLDSVLFLPIRTNDMGSCHSYNQSIMANDIFISFSICNLTFFFSLLFPRGIWCPTTFDSGMSPAVEHGICSVQGLFHDSFSLSQCVYHHFVSHQLGSFECRVQALSVQSQGNIHAKVDYVVHSFRLAPLHILGRGALGGLGRDYCRRCHQHLQA